LIYQHLQAFFFFEDTLKKAGKINFLTHFLHIHAFKSLNDFLFVCFHFCRSYQRLFFRFNEGEKPEKVLGSFADIKMMIF
jgi:hypothetical protein